MKTHLPRQFVWLAVTAGLIVAFQNCGQPGEIALTRNPISTSLSVPDPVTLISNPAIKINNGDPYTKSKNVSLQLSAVGAEEMQVSNDPDCGKSSTWEAYSQNKAWVLSEDNHNNIVYARFQKTGAPATDCVQAAIIHDDLPPTLGITKNADAVTSLANVQVGFIAQDTGSGIAAVYCKPAGGGAEVTCDSIYDFTGLVEGSHGVVIRAVDKAGNESNPVSSNFIVDRTAPVITINGPSGLIGTTKVTYQISVVESNGLKSVECRLSPLEANYKDCSTLKVDYDTIASGAFTFDVKATDKAGNSSTKSQSINVDTSVPSVTITKSPAAIGNVKNVAFEFTGISGSKPITKFKCSLDGAALAACSSPMSYSNLTDKSHTFGVMGTNDVGVDSSLQTYTFIVDTVPPVIKITSSPTGVTKDKNAVIVLEATDQNGIKSISCTLDGVVSNCSSKTFTAAVNDGTHTFTAKAIDNAGNESVTPAITWKVDTTPDSSIIASMAVNPVKEGQTGTLNITLNLVTGAGYSCKTVAGNANVINGSITGNTAAVNFVVNEDISCLISGKDKNNMDISKTVTAEVGCGNRVKEGNKCVDFKCLKIVNIPYTNKFIVPKRTTEGICYSMKLFNSIANSPSSLTKEIDQEVVTRDHDKAGINLRNPYILGKDLLNFILEGKRVAKLSGGANITSPIKVDNFVLVGLYPEAVQPQTSHYSAQGTIDSTVTAAQTHILMNNQAVGLKSFGPSGTATVAPIEIVREADENLSYMLDLRALDCGGVRELSEIYIVFQ